MSEEVLENGDEADPQAAAKLVPVGESIKYRRRAQQAEARIQQLEQQLKDVQSQVGRHSEELAAAESQRDEAKVQLTATENRLGAERLLNAVGVADVETAVLLLSKRLDFAEEIDAETFSRQIEQLLLDKPFLRSGAEAALPPKTASARPAQTSVAAQLSRAAQRAVQSGNRRDIAEYLRLRRQAATR